MPHNYLLCGEYDDWNSNEQWVVQTKLLYSSIELYKIVYILSCIWLTNEVISLLQGKKDWCLYVITSYNYTHNRSILNPRCKF